jgi:hypothetical protein
MYVDSADGHLVHLVAVLAKSGDAYLLSGFDDAFSEFNRLVIDASLRISTAKDAEMYARFCFSVISDPSANRLIYSPRQLKHTVEDYFYSNYAKKKAQSAYNKWWSGLSSARLRIPFETAVAKSAVGYETRLL